MLPKLLYELKPVLYVAVGLAAVLLLYNSYAILSGILLLSVGLVILYMRLESRTRWERLYTRRTKSRRSVSQAFTGTPQKAWPPKKKPRRRAGLGSSQDRGGLAVFVLSPRDPPPRSVKPPLAHDGTGEDEGQCVGRNGYDPVRGGGLDPVCAPARPGEHAAGRPLRVSTSQHDGQERHRACPAAGPGAGSSAASH